MTRRSKTRAAAEAKPALKSTQTRTKPPRGAKTAPIEPGETETAAPSPPAKAPAKAASAKTKASAKASNKTPNRAKPAKNPTTSVAKAEATKAKAASRRVKPTAPSDASTNKVEARTARGTAKRGSKKSDSGKTAATKAATASAPPAKPATGKKAAAKPAKPAKRATKAAKSPAPRRKAAQGPAYLAAELGQPVDREGEPIGAGSAMLDSDSVLQEYALRLWRQMQSGGVVNRYMRAIERAGLTVDEVWTAGVVETRSTLSTADEMRRYKQRLLFRANLLEAILTETVADLHRLDGIVPSDAPSQPPPDAAGGSA